MFNATRARISRPQPRAGASSHAAQQARIAVADRSAEWLFRTTAICPAFRVLPAVVLAGLAGAAQANPQGGVVVGGSAQITTTPGKVEIIQGSDRAAINWNSFSIAKGEQTSFIQPSRDAIALNRVTGGSRSDINGLLSANGNIVVINPNGILFGKDSQVNVGGIIASTTDMSTDRFMAGGPLVFDIPGNPNATIVNQGTISVRDAGLGAFVAPGVQNAGLIQAKLGTVSLASGTKFTLDLYGDKLVKLLVDDVVAGQLIGADGVPLSARVDNSGRILADGGTVYLTVDAAKSLVDNAISVSGTIQARSAVEQNGKIVLQGRGGTVRVAGMLDASAQQDGLKGGTVEVTGERVALENHAMVNVSGPIGGGTVLVGGAYQGKGPQQNAKRSFVGKNARIDASATKIGDAGTVILWSDEYTQLHGTITAKGGPQGGNGGFVETSGKLGLQASGVVNASAPNGLAGTWLLDPTNVIVANGGTATTGDVDQFGDNACGTCTISPATLDAAGTTVVIQATNDITFTDPVSLTTLNAGLTAQAGNNINVNSTITTNNGVITLSARDPGTTQVAGGTVNVNAALNSNGAAINITNNGSTTALALGANVTATGDTVALSSGPGGINQTGGAITANTLTANSTGTVSLGQTNAVAEIGASTSGAGGFSFTNGATLTVAAPLNTGSTGATTLTTTAGNLTLDAAVGNTSATTTLNSAGTISGAGAINANNLNLTAGGNITPTGVITALGTTTITANAAAMGVTLANASNDFNIVTLANGTGNFGTVSLTDATGIVLGGGSVATLNVAAGGSITQSGALTVAGTTTLTSNAAGITADLSTQANDFGTVTLVNGTGSFGTVSLNDINSIDLGGGAASALNVAAAGTISQSAALTVSGTTTLTSNVAGLTANLSTQANNFGTVTLSNGTGTFGTVLLRDITGIVLGGGSAGTLGVRAGGDITQSGALTVSGTTTLTADTGAIAADLSTQANDFGTVTLATTGGGSFTTVSLNDTGVIDLGGGAAGTLSVAAGGDVTQSGALTLTTLTGNAGGSVTLADAGNAITNLGAFTSNGLNLNDSAGGLNVTGTVNAGTGLASIVTTGGPLALGSNNVSGAGVGLQGAGVTSTGGTVDGGSGDILVNGGGSAISLAGALTTTSNNATAVTVRNATTVALGNVTTGGTGTTTIGVAGDVTGAVTQTGVISTGTLTGNTASSVTLGGANTIANLGAFTTNGNFSLNDTTLGLTLTGAVNAGAGAVAITTAGGALALGANNITGAGVSLTGTGVTQTGGTVDAGAGTILVDANDGAINMAGTLTTTNATATAVQIVDSSTATLGNITTGAGGTVTLGGAAAGDDLSGAVTQTAGTVINTTNLTGTAGSTVTLGNNNAITNLGTFSANGLTVVDGAGADGLTITGPVNGGTGGVAVTTTQGNLTVSSTVTGVGVTLQTTTAGGLLTVNDPVGGAEITSTGAVSMVADDMAINGQISATGQTVTLRPNNTARAIDVGGPGGATLGLTDAELDNITAAAIVVGATTQTGAISITAPTNPANAANLTLLNNTAGIAVGADATVTGTLTLTANGGGAAAGAITRTAGTLTAPTVNLNAATGIGSAGAVFTAAATLSATNTGASGNINVTENDGVTVAALQQTNAANTGGTVTLVSNTGDVGLNNGSVLSQGGLITLTATAGAITDADSGTAASVINTGGRANLAAATGIGSAEAIETTLATLSATNGGGSGNVNITETDGVTVAALQQTGGANTAGTVTLVSNTGNIALSDSSVLSQGGLITLTATAGAITDADGGTTVSITNSTGQATLTAATGIGTAADAIETSIATLAATNTTSGDIVVAEASGLVIGGSGVQTQGGSGNIEINVAAGDLTVGQAVSTSASGNITLAAAGNIALDASVTAADTLTLSAGAAITQTAGFAAPTLTGSAGTTATLGQTNVIANLGPFTTGSGFSLSNLGGLTVTGNVAGGTGLSSITTLGMLTVNAGQTISGAGVTLVAAGGGNDLVLNGSANAGAGTLTLTASGAITQGAGSVATAGTLTGSAGTTATLDQANAITNLGAFTTGTGLTLNDGGGLTVTGNVAGGAGLASITTSGTLAVNPGHTVSGTGVTLAATGGASDIALNGNANAGAGTLTLNAGRAIVQGGGSVATADALTGTAGTTATLNQANAITNLGAFTTGGGLTLVDATGGLTVTGPVTGGSGAASLQTSGGALAVNNTVTGATVTLNSTDSDVALNAAVTTPGTLTMNAGGTVTEAVPFTAGATAITVAGGDLALNLDNDTGTLAISAPGRTVSYRDTNGFAVGTIGGVAGITSGPLTLASNTGGITINSAVTASGPVAITADDMQINAALNAAGQIVTLRSTSGGREINLGTEVGGRLSLTDAELDRINAAILRLGDAAAGQITVASTVSPAGVPTFHLITGAGVTGAAGGIVVPNLAVETRADVAMTGPNDADVLAINPNGANVTFNDVDGFQIGTVDGVTGITGNTVILTSGGQITQASDANVRVTSLGIRTSAGGVSLPGQNDVAATTLAIDSPGQNVLFNDINGLTIGVVGDISGIRAGNATITAGGAITQNAAINAGSVDLNANGNYVQNAAITGGTAIIRSSGSVSQTAPITSSNLGVRASRSITLDRANDVDQVALDAGGSLVFVDTDGFRVGTVGDVSGLRATNATLTANRGQILIENVVAEIAGILRISADDIVIRNVRGRFTLVVERGALTIEGTSVQQAATLGVLAALAIQRQIEDLLGRGEAGQTPAQQAFQQSPERPGFGLDPFAQRYDVLGVDPGGAAAQFSDVSYVTDTFWEGLIREDNRPAAPR